MLKNMKIEYSTILIFSAQTSYFILKEHNKTMNQNYLPKYKFVVTLLNMLLGK